MSFCIFTNCLNSNDHGKVLGYRPLTPPPPGLNAITVTFEMLAFRVDFGGIEGDLHYQRARQLA